MATAVTNSNLFSQSWTEVYNIVSGSLVSSVKAIYSQWPDKPITNKAGYPMVIVGRTSLTDDEMVSFDLRHVNMSCDIGVYSTKNAELDTLCSTLFNSLRSNTKTMEEDSHLDILSVSSSDNDDFERDGIRLHTRTIRIDFKVFGAVS